MKNKNQELLDDFRDFCLAHPELRFWQALRAWAGASFVLISDVFDGNMFEKEYMKENEVEIYDTYYSDEQDGR